MTICGQAQAQQPATAPTAPAAVPDQMPFDIPYGNSITADRAADIVKAVVAEATKSPRNWKLAISVVDTHGELVYFYKMDSTQHGVGDDLAEQGPDGSAPSPPDADLQQRDADPAGAYIATLDLPRRPHLPAASRLSRAARSSVRSVAAAPPAIRMP